MRIETLENRKLSLSNNGNLELFFVGVGNAFTKRQYQTNLLVIKGNDHLLVDCGTRCPNALYDLGIGITDIRNILITHSHADHIGGLEEAAIMGRFFAHRKPFMVINEAYQEILWNMSLRGGLGFNEAAPGSCACFSDYFDVIRPEWVPGYPRESYSASVGGIGVRLIRTKHIPDSAPDWSHSFWSCCVMIDDRVLFTSDTRFDPELLNFCDREFKLEGIFHDCQFFTGGVHAGLEELSGLPEAMKKKIHLTHYGDNWEQFAASVRERGFSELARQHVFYTFE
jgi:hypothetical protein